MSEGSHIIAVVSIHREQVGGGAPMFFVEKEEQLQETAFKLEKILNATAHDLGKGIIIIVKH